MKYSISLDNRTFFTEHLFTPHVLHCLYQICVHVDSDAISRYLDSPVCIVNVDTDSINLNQYKKAMGVAV